MKHTAVSHTAEQKVAKDGQSWECSLFIISKFNVVPIQYVPKQVLNSWKELIHLEEHKEWSLLCKNWYAQIKDQRKPSASQSVFNKIPFRQLIKESKSNLFPKILTSPWRSHGCPRHLSFLYKELQGLTHQRQTLKTKKAMPNQDFVKSLIDKVLGPPCSWSFTAVFVATLQANKNILHVCNLVFLGYLQRNWPGAKRVPPQTDEPSAAVHLYPVVQVEGVAGEPGLAGLPGWVSKPSTRKIPALNVERRPNVPKRVSYLCSPEIRRDILQHLKSVKQETQMNIRCQSKAARFRSGAFTFTSSTRWCIALQK